MNAETRAKEVMAWLRQECSDSICTHLDCPSCGCMAYLAQALHQAQNDKLEEAARAAEQSHLGMSCFVDAVDCGQFNSGVRHAAKAVRSLIQKD